MCQVYKCDYIPRMTFRFLFSFLGTIINWDLAIKRNSDALRDIIRILFALLGLDGTDTASRIPRSLHSAMLGVLRPGMLW